ncbi:hypothetical protein [Brevibacillus borstelensis]|uniref:hypothetical protein n=1 Tax=Brevibacillus TaxID=55080 RepID=UPI0030F60D80
MKRVLSPKGGRKSDYRPLHHFQNNYIDVNINAHVYVGVDETKTSEQEWTR